MRDLRKAFVFETEDFLAKFTIKWDFGLGSGFCASTGSCSRDGELGSDRLYEVSYQRDVVRKTDLGMKRKEEKKTNVFLAKSPFLQRR